MSNQSQHDVSGRSRLVVNVITSWFSHLLIIITGFFMPRLIDEQLGQEMVGIWDFSWSLVAYLTLAQLGIGSSLNRFVSNYRAEGKLDELKAATSTVTLIQFLLAILIAVAISIFAYLIPDLYQEKLGKDIYTAQSVVLYLGLAISAQFLFDTSRGVLTGSHRWDLYNALYSGNQIVCSLVMIGALMMGEGLVTISLVYLIMIFAEGVTRSILAIKICPESRFKFSALSLTFAIEITSFGIKAFVMGIMGVVVIQGSNIMIASTLGPAALAIIARPNALIRHLQTFITRFTFILTPMAGPILTKEGPEALRTFTVNCSRYGLAFTLPLLTLFCFYGDELIYLWMGSDYVNEGLIWILGLGAVLPLSQGVLSRILIGLDYHSKAALLSVGLSFPMFFAGLWIISETGHSLEAYALLTGIVLTAVYGLAIPCFALIKLNIPILLYLTNVFGKVLPVWAITTAQLVIIDKLTTHSGIWILFNVFFFLITTAILYWWFILPNDAKEIVRTRYFSSFYKPEPENEL